MFLSWGGYHSLRDSDACVFCDVLGGGAEGVDTQWSVWMFLGELVSAHKLAAAWLSACHGSRNNARPRPSLHGLCINNNTVTWHAQSHLHVNSRTRNSRSSMHAFPPNET